MREVVTWFDPQPAPDEVAERMPDPWGRGRLGPALARAWSQVMDEIAAGPWAQALGRPGEGKMFGVLLVRAPDGRVGFLRAVSGMVDGSWQHPGWAPPLFELEEHQRIWRLGELELARLDAELSAAQSAPERLRCRAELDQLVATHELEREELRRRHQQRRRQRRARRQARDADPDRLDGESRADKAEKVRMRRTHAEALSALEAQWADFESRRRLASETLRQRSTEVLMELFDSYRVVNARGERSSLRRLFAEVPPGGAGDCAAPKLLGAAYALGLRPLELAEGWWGSPPPSGGRLHGRLYPPCRGKCGPILSFMLDGVTVDWQPPPGSDPPAIAAPLDIVYEDRWLVVVAKPAGLLSVPGKGPELRDSVLTRLRQHGTGRERPAHRLDLGTSGLLVVARDPDMYRDMQALFAERRVEKVYLAELEGRVEGDAGRIELPLRGDPHDRPRQIVCDAHGKPAQTDWRVRDRTAHTSWVEFRPWTGRTHQIRVHAAHPRGLGAAIVGDPLYGRGGERMKLHAERLRFVHPRSGVTLDLYRADPWR